ncbi:hypothetical protein MPTA5024_39170, partial [Microbispora sp. ATCC PTA-5024]
LPAEARRADVFDAGGLREVLGGRRPGVVVTDVPYGEQTSWLGPDGESGAAGMLRTLGAVLPEGAVIAVAVRGRRPPRADGADGLVPRGSFKIGTRTVALFQTAAAGPRDGDGRRTAP